MLEVAQAIEGHDAVEVGRVVGMNTGQWHWDLPPTPDVLEKRSASTSPSSNGCVKLVTKRFR